MSLDSLTIPCPKCGKLNEVTFAGAVGRQQYEHTCVNCGTRFAVDADELRQAPEQEGGA